DLRQIERENPRFFRKGVVHFVAEEGTEPSAVISTGWQPWPDAVDSVSWPSCTSPGRISSSYRAPAVVERERPNMADGIRNSENSGISRIGCVLNHVQPVRLALFACVLELRV